MTQLITGDAVTLQLRVAAFPSRLLALTVDLVVQVSLLMGALVLLEWAFSAGGSPGAQASVSLVAVVLVLVGWPTMLETLTRGRSLGKMMMGLRVVRDDGGPIRMRHSLVRALAMVFLDLWTTSGVVGTLSSLASARAKRMGDHLAGTIVVGERLPRSAVAGQVEILMPPPLAAWASGLDLVAVPDGLALNARTFLHRAPTLATEARSAVAARLATEMAAHVRTPPPPGTPAEAYLAAVLAERTRRASPIGARVGAPYTGGGYPGGGYPGGPVPGGPVPGGPYPGAQILGAPLPRATMAGDNTRTAPPAWAPAASTPTAQTPPAGPATPAGGAPVPHTASPSRPDHPGFAPPA